MLVFDEYNGQWIDDGKPAILNNAPVQPATLDPVNTSLSDAPWPLPTPHQTINRYQNTNSQNSNNPNVIELLKSHNIGDKQWNYGGYNYSIESLYLFVPIPVFVQSDNIKGVILHRASFYYGTMGLILPGGFVASKIIPNNKNNIFTEMKAIPDGANYLMYGSLKKPLLIPQEFGLWFICGAQQYVDTLGAGAFLMQDRGVALHASYTFLT
jgi:hypothetical protein